MKKYNNGRPNIIKGLHVSERVTEIAKEMTPTAIQTIINDLDLTLSGELVTFTRSCLLAIQRSLSLRDQSEYAGQSKTAKKLLLISAKCINLYNEINDLDKEAKDYISNYQSKVTAYEKNKIGPSSLSEKSLYKEYQESHAGLLKLTRLLELTSMYIEHEAQSASDLVIALRSDEKLEQSRKWKDTYKREESINLAYNLSNLFEESFNIPTTVNNWSENLQGQWPSFYKLIYKLVFPKRNLSNLESVLREARKLHKEQPVKFDI